MKSLSKICIFMFVVALFSCTGGKQVEVAAPDGFVLIKGAAFTYDYG
jgi:hypothetical protein